MSKPLIDYNEVAIKIIAKYKSGLTITSNQLAKEFGYENLKDIKNFSQMKSKVSEEMKKHSYLIDKIKNVGYVVRKINEYNKTYKSDKEKETINNVSAFDQIVKKTKESFSTTKKEIVKQDNCKIKVEVKNKKDGDVMTIEDILKVIKENRDLEPNMNEILKPLGKKVEFIPMIIDIQKEGD